MKAGILLAAFGSGSNQGESALRGFEAQVRARFPAVAVRWAFTSGLMRERLASARKKSDSVRKALDKMAFERFTHVAVQPLHVISGLEYSDILSDAAVLRQQKGFASLVVGAPLLTKTGLPLASKAASDAPLVNAVNAPQNALACNAMACVTAAMLAALPKERGSNEAVLFMGHGTRHPAERLYEALSVAVQDRDPLVFMGTLNGALRLEQLLPQLLASGVQRAWLMPFLAVVGRHTLEDMAGSSEGSWLSRLQTAGIPCVPVLHGMIEYPAFCAIWIDNLARCMRDWDAFAVDSPPCTISD